MTLLEEISAISNIVMGACTVILTVLAFFGLKSWRKQIAGETHHNLAVRTVTACYKLRSDIWSTRLPGSIEELQGYFPEKKTDPLMASFNRVAYTYTNRLKRLRPTDDALQLLELEVLAILGPEKSRCVASLRAKAKELYDAWRELYPRSITRIREKTATESRDERISKLRELLWAHSEYDGPTDSSRRDYFQEEVEAALRGVEEALRLYLKP